MVRVRIAEVVAVVALAGGLAACSSSSSKPAAAPAAGTSTSQSAPSSSALTTSSSATGGAGATTASGTTTSDTAASSGSSQATTQPTAKSGSASSDGGGVANAGDKVTIVGTLNYLAPGKFIVHPDDGSTDQGFYVADDTKILGAAAICGGPDGRVTIGGDDYGTTKCTEAELETAAKTNAVKVRITMDRKTGAVATVEEKYHP